jgi:hypothetical protein
MWGRYVRPEKDLLVGCGDVNHSDPDTNWVLEFGGHLVLNTEFKIVHEMTGLALHSHPLKTAFEPRFQEVTCSTGRTDNDRWEVAEMRAVQFDADLDELDLAGPCETPGWTPDPPDFPSNGVGSTAGGLDDLQLSEPEVIPFRLAPNPSDIVSTDPTSTARDDAVGGLDDVQVAGPADIS